jgi:hypothetical protein
MMYLVKYGEAAVFDGWKLPNTTTGEFVSNPTLASGDVKLSKDGGTLTNVATLPTLSPASSTEVHVALSATETQCRIGTINFIDQTGTKEWNDNSYQFFTFGHPSAYFPFDFGTPTVALSPASLDQVQGTVWGAQRASHNTMGSFGESIRLTSDERESFVNFLLDFANTIEADVNLRGALRLILASSAGTSSGVETGTILINNAVANDKTRITMLTDSNGNRVAGTYDQTT